jgi:ABC-2 type transport system ATP-binding protein
VISISHLTKRYGPQLAVDDLSFEVQPGIVTGFLGPNGAGKSTTMRLVMGLDTPNSGTATVNGKRMAEHRAPLTQIGTLLDAQAVEPKRSARNHLLALAATTGIPARRVDEVLGIVGLSDVAGRAAGGFSLGMSQRLGIASALLGDPETVMLDEPVNGLDPDGILWMRSLLRGLAAEGRTVFVSSHLMTEMALIAHQFVIIGRGRLILDVSSGELQQMSSGSQVRVRTDDMRRLRDILIGQATTVTDETPDTAIVTGLSSAVIARAAFDAGLLLTELTPLQATLEDTFMRLTHDAVDFHTTEPKAA